RGQSASYKLTARLIRWPPHSKPWSLCVLPRVEYNVIRGWWRVVRHGSRRCFSARGDRDMDWEQGEESQNLEDRRRMSPKTIAVGGGIGALIIVLIGVFLGVDPNKLNQMLGGGGGGGGEGGGEKRPLTEQEERTRRFSSKILGFTEKVWDEQFKKIGKRYDPPKMVLFSNQVDTGCGTAPSAVGPFRCPASRTAYLDPAFFDELEQKLGGSKAEFSQAYVIAHEVGHHVQNLLSYSQKLDQKRRELSKREYNKWSVRLELQADYLAGVWAHFGQMKWKF